MRLPISVLSCAILAGCSFDMDPCAGLDDLEPEAESWAELATSSAAADATVGHPVSVYVQYVVDWGESCGGELNESCGCSDPGPSPETFDVVDVGCDDDACDVLRVSDYVSTLREIVIVPKRDTVTVRARLTSPGDDEEAITGAVRIALPR